jgi:hypothetical protein
MTAVQWQAWEGPKEPRQALSQRRPGQVVRTSHVDMAWSNGIEGGLALHGVARDVRTGADSAAIVVLQHAELRAAAGADRVLRTLSTSPDVPALAALVGMRLGPGFRAAVDAALAGTAHRGSPLSLLLDEMPVTALISGFAVRRQMLAAGAPRTHAPLSRIGTCAGWRDGGAPATRARAEEPALLPNVVSAQPPERSDDVWHAMSALPPETMRRRRRLDVAPGSPVQIEAYLRDSVGESDGSEAALHEYTVAGEVDTSSATVLWLEATPHVLPYVDCVGAVASAQLLAATPLRELRQAVRARLGGEVGCTHLNDVLRSIADVEHLVRLVET